MLEKLHLDGVVNQYSSFVLALASNQQLIRLLEISIEELNVHLANAFKEVTMLENLRIKGLYIPGCFERILNPPLIDSPKELAIHQSGDSQNCSEKDFRAI